MGIPETFLLDEVRCGFPVPSAIKQAWAAELEVLMEIDRVCRKHNIQYFADWGTLLGAVRHGGFIPWDDDLDIVMKRADYEKFMSVARYDMEEGFDVQTFRNQKDFWLFMGKVVGKNRFCFEKEHLRRFHNFPYIACVDIFVLDYVYRDPEKEEQRRNLCKYMLGVADAIVEGRLSAAERMKSLNIIREMSGKQVKDIADPVEMGRYLYGEVERIFAEVPESEADMLTQLFPWGLKGNYFHFPKEYYKEAIYLPFECTTMPVPQLYDKMLRMRYGDYLKLVKDAGAHNYPFFEGQKANLQKVLDFELPEFKFRREMLHRSQEELESKGYSYKVMAKECAQELWRMRELLGEICRRQMVEQMNLQQAVELLQNSQQLAVDLGTLMEQMLGEGLAIVCMLEQYCEVLYQLYEVFVKVGEAASVINQWDGRNNSPVELMERLEVLQEKISSELEVLVARKTVFFLPVLAKDWECLRSLWQAAAKDSFCDVYVVPLPYYYKDYDASPKEILCDWTEFPEEVSVQDYRFLTAEYLEMLHPEVIIIQNPYDRWNPAFSVPEMFFAENIRKYTDSLIYVPPFTGQNMRKEVRRENARACSNMKYYVTMPGVVYADKILVQSENVKRLYVEKLTEFAGEETRTAWEQRIEELKLPVQDKRKAYCDAEQVKRKKKILYGISRGTYLEDPQAAEQKMRRNLEIFEHYREQIEVTILHFPEDKMCTVEGYDAYYGDPMPIVVEFTQAGKPVMIQNIEV